MPNDTELIPALLAVAPGFENRWQQYLARWSPDALGDYNAMAEFAQYLVDSYAGGDISWMPKFFEVVEQFMCEGGSTVRSVLAIGLFEDIQAISSHRSIDGAAFEIWLGPRSRQAWREVDENMRRVAESARATAPARPVLDFEKMLSEVENPELRKIIETLYWKK